MRCFTADAPCVVRMRKLTDDKAMQPTALTQLRNYKFLFVFFFTQKYENIFPFCPIFCCSYDIFLWLLIYEMQSK